MKEYCIISNIYSPRGGLYKYAENPEKKPFKACFSKNEREEFVSKWKYILKEDMYFDDPKVFLINYETVTIAEITDKLDEIENSI